MEVPVSAIDSVVRILDFVLQGLMLLLLLAYLLHDTAWFRNWARMLASRFSEDHGQSWFTETVLLVIAIGAMYSLGLITNSGSYLAIQSAHESIIETVQETHSLHVFSGSLLLSPWRGLRDVSSGIFRNPRRVIESHQEVMHVRSLCEDIAWENQAHDVAKDALDPLVKQLRVQRGAIVFCSALMTVIALKILYKVLKMISEPFKKVKLGDLADIKPCSYWFLPWKIPLGLGALALHFVIVALIYVYCVQAWAFVEADYHSTVYYGLRTAKPSSPPNPWDVICSGMEH